MTRHRKIQGRYKVSGLVGQRTIAVLPSLQLSGCWFLKAGFKPGQRVNIDVKEGVLTIRPQ